MLKHPDSWPIHCIVYTSGRTNEDKQLLCHLIIWKQVKLPHTFVVVELMLKTTKM